MKTLCVIVLSMVVAACVPMRAEYLRPSAEGGTLLYGSCDGTPNTIEVRVAGSVKATITAWAADGESFSGVIEYKLPKSSGLSALPAAVVVVDTSDPKAHRAVPFKVSSKWDNGDKSLVVAFAAAYPLLQSFTVQVPSLTLPDEVTKNPIVQFRRVRKVIFLPLCT